MSESVRQDPARRHYRRPPAVDHRHDQTVTTFAALAQTSPGAMHQRLRAAEALLVAWADHCGARGAHHRVARIALRLLARRHAVTDSTTPPTLWADHAASDAAEDVARERRHLFPESAQVRETHYRALVREIDDKLRALAYLDMERMR
jgi:hypothetical protein